MFSKLKTDPLRRVCFRLLLLTELVVEPRLEALRLLRFHISRYRLGYGAHHLLGQAGDLLQLLNSALVALKGGLNHLRRLLLTLSELLKLHRILLLLLQHLLVSHRSLLGLLRQLMNDLVNLLGLGIRVHVMTSISGLDYRHIMTARKPFYPSQTLYEQAPNP